MFILCEDFLTFMLSIKETKAFFICILLSNDMQGPMKRQFHLKKSIIVDEPTLFETKTKGWAEFIRFCDGYPWIIHMKKKQSKSNCN